MKSTMIFIAAVLLICCGELHADTDISPLFDKMSAINAITGEMIEEMDVTSEALTAVDGVFPLEILMELSDESAQPPVVTGIELMTPEDMCDPDASLLMELWGEFDYGSLKFDRLLHKDVISDCSISIPIIPFKTAKIMLRLFSDNTGETTIPMLTLMGAENDSAYTLQYDADNTAFQYILRNKDGVFGEASIEVSSSSLGSYFSFKSEGTLTLKSDVDEDDPKSKQTVETNTVTEECKALIGKDMALIEFSCRDDTESGYLTKASGYFADNVFSIDFSQNGVRDTELKSEGLPVFFDDMPVPLIMKYGLVVGNTVTAYGVNPNELSYYSIKFISVIDYVEETTELPSYFIVAVHSFRNELQSVFFVKSDGTIIRSYNLADDMGLILVDNPDDYEINPMVIDFDLKSEEYKDKMRNYIRVPGAVLSSNIKFQWDNLPPDKFYFDSPRQHLVEITESSPGHYEAEIMASRYLPGDDPMTDAEPLSDKELQTYISVSDTTPAGNEDIERAARNIADGETDHLALAMKIYRYVASGMKGENTRSYFVQSASRLIFDKSGDCKQFATLFAALARASGIPTRYALGRRYLGGSYGYHVWNQIYYDKRWIDIDATDMAVFPGATHIQYLTARSFNEHAVFAALIGLNDEPEIVEHELTESFVVDPVNDTDVVLTCPD